jgi:hypothetical protein
MAESPLARLKPVTGEWRPGTPVAVHNRFTERWTEGFVIAESEDRPEAGYWLRRSSDGVVLPVPFSPSELRVL